MATDRPGQDPGSNEDAIEHIVHHSPLPDTRLSLVLDRLVAAIGRTVSWGWILLMLVICLNVFMKNVLQIGSIRLEEIQWHIYAALFLTGFSYAFVRDDHVRVDVLHERLSPRGAARVEIAGILFLLFPFLAVLLRYTVPFVLKAYETGERSMSPAGLSNYWILKAILLLSLVLLLLAAIARLSRCVAALRQPALNGASRP